MGKKEGKLGEESVTGERGWEKGRQKRGRVEDGREFDSRRGRGEKGEEKEDKGYKGGREGRWDGICRRWNRAADMRVGQGKREWYREVSREGNKLV